MQMYASRFLGAIVITLFGYAIQVQIYEYKHIDYELIWDLPHGKVTAGYRAMLAHAAAFGIVALLCVMMCYSAQTGSLIRIPFGNLL